MTKISWLLSFVVGAQAHKLDTFLQSFAAETNDTQPSNDTKPVNVNLPPTDGKFFFMDFRSGNHYGQHYIDFNVEGQAQTLWLSTNQHELSVVSSGCKECNVPNKINLPSDLIADSKSFSQVVRLVEGTTIVDVVAKGRQTKELDMYVDYEKFKRRTNLDIPLSEITSSQPFSSGYNGYFGIKPHGTLFEEKKARNVMYSLQK